MNKPNDNSLFLFIGLLLIVITLSAFWQVLGSDFVNYDDDEYVTQNVHVQRGLTSGSIVWAFTKYYASNWHPLSWISHMLDYEVWGLNPMGHHLTSLIFHILNTLLLFAMLRLMTGCAWRSGFVAALFAVHPLHVESVAWISERKDVLSTFFMLLTMIVYVGYVRSKDKRKYALVTVLYAMGLMAKPMLVTLPLLLLLLDYWPLERVVTEGKKSCSSWKSLIIEKIPLFLLATLSSIITFIVQQKDGSVGTVEAFPLGIRIANAFVAYISYLIKMIYPANLAVFYPHPKDAIPEWQTIGSVLLLIFLTVFFIRMGKKREYLTVGWLWYIVTLIPVIGLVQVGWQALADRYTYIPFIGIFIIIAWGVPELLSRFRWFRHSYIVPLSIAVILCLATVSSFQVRHWKDSVSLFKCALARTSDNYVVQANLGASLLEEGEVDEAARYLRAAVEINPNYANAHSNLGSALALQKKYPEAIAHFNKAIRLKPGYADAHNNLGLALERVGKPQEALEQYEKAIRFDPDYPDAYNNMGALLGTEGRFVEAIDCYEKALQLNPDHPDAHTNLGIALSALGDVDSAIEHYNRALRLKPFYAEAHMNLGNALARRGQMQEAASHLRQAIRSKPDYAEAYGNLGAAMAAMGHLDDAISHYQKALDIKPDYAAAHSNLAAALYAKGEYSEAWREIHRAQRLGLAPPPMLLEDLARNMPEPDFEITSQ